MSEQFQIPTNINPVEPIDLSIFKTHVNRSLMNILDTVKYKTLIFISFRSQKKKKL